MEIAKLYIALAADASSYQGTLQQVDRDTMSWASGLADRMAKTLGTAILAAVAAMTIAIGGFFVSAVDKAADLEAQMDTVAALLGATAEQAELLRQATIDLALDPNLKVSATEAAQAIEMLAQNGLTVEEILGGAARATVLLANATGADFSTAAQIATDAMALWEMEAGDLEQVANGVTAVLVQSKFEVNDYAQALAQAGGVASSVGVSFEDFNATLVAIAPYFASGSDAGTSYKTMLQRLIPTTSSAKDAMAALGLITEDGSNAFFDSQGNMRDMAEVAGILNGALGGLTEQQRLQALSTIFGTDAMRAAVAMSQFTEEEFRRLQAVMANTSAAEIAAQRMQNFSGAMEIFQGVVEGLQLQLGNVLLPILTKLALEGANLLAAWGPPLIAAFERLTAIIGEFFSNIESGTSIWGALKSALMDIGQLLGMTADEAIAFAAGVTNTVQAIVGFIGPIAQAIASFVSWKDAMLAFGLVALWAVGTVLLPMLAPIAAIVAAVAGLALAIAAVRTAFETNFLGIRDLALGLWSALQQVFEGIKALLAGDTTAAMTAFRSAWETGWNAIVGFIQNAGAQIGQALAGLWQSIVAWFQGIDWGALGQSLIERFFAGMAALGQAAASSWEWLLTSLTNFVQSVDWAAVGHTLIDLLVSGIVGAIGLIGTALAGIVTFIWNFITGTNWIELGINLVSAIIEGLRSFAQGAGAALAEWRQVIFDWAGAEDWSGVAEHIATMVGDALGTAKEAISAKLSEWQTAIFDWAGAEDWGDVAEYIAEMIGEGLGEAGDAIAGQLSEWQTAIFDWAGAEDWGDVAEYIAEMIGEGLGEAGDAIAGQLSEWQSAIFDWADAEDWQGVAEHIAESVGEKLGEAADAIADKLSEWQTAIFDWAGVEDWSGVAQKVAEMIGTALGDAARCVVSTLDSWEQAIFDWAGGADWGDVAESIAVSVGDSLVDVSDKVTEKLSSWITAFTDWVNSVDWYQVGYDIMFKITDAFLDFKTAITEKISTWLDDTKTATEGYAWYEVGAYILLEIAKSAAGVVEDWGQAVGAWISNIGAAITAHLGNLAQVGRDIVAGIAAGISGGWDLIQGAIDALGDRTAQETPPAFQQNSPSRFAIPVGIGIDEGVALGVTQGAGLIVNAIQSVAGSVVSAIQEVASSTEITGIKEFVDALKSIAEAMAPAMASIVMILAFNPGDTSSLTAAVAKVAELVRIIVAGFADANDQTDEALASVGEFVSAGSSIVGLLGESMGIMAQLAAVTLPDVNGAMLENLARLRDFVASLVAGFGLAAVELSALSPIVEDFAGAAESVINLIDQALPAIAALYAVDLSKYTASYHLADQMIIFRKVIKELVKQFIESAAEFSYMSDAVESFTSAASSIVDLISQALPVIAVLFSADLSKYVSSYHLADQMIIFRKVIKELVSQFAGAAAEFAYMGDAVESFVGAAEAVVGLIGLALPAIAALFAADLSKYVASYQLANQMIIFRKVIRELVNQFSMVAAEFAFMSDEVIRLTDAAGSILDLLSQTMEVLGQVAEFTGFGSDISGRLALLGQMLVTLVVALATSLAAAAAQSGAAITAAAALADSVGQLLDVVEAGVDALAALATFTSIAGVQAAAMAFANQLVAVLMDLTRAFTAAASNAGAAITEAAEFADQAEGILDVVEPGIEALAGLATFAPIAGIRVNAMAFANQLVAVLLELANAFAAAANNAGAVIAQAAVFADQAEDILDVIEPGVEALAALSTFAPIAGIRIAAMAFANQLVAVLAELANAFSAAAAGVGEVMAQAADFADSAADILDVVEPGVEALAGLAAYVSTTGIEAAVQTFAADLITVVLALVNAFQQAGLLANQAVAEAGEMAGAIEDIVSVVEPAVEAVVFLVGYTTVGGLKTNAEQFAADLVTVVQTLVDGLAQAGLLANQAVAEAGEMAGHIEDILKVVEPALHPEKGALSLIAKYVSDGGLLQKAQQFITDLVAVTQTLVDGLTTSALASGVALAKAGEMADHLKNLFDAIKPALDAIADIAAYTSTAGLTQKAQQFTSDLVAVATVLVTGLTAAANQLGAEAVSAAHAFAQSVSLMVARIQAVVESLNTLGAIATPNIEPKLVYIVQSAQQITTSFAAAGDIGAAVQYAENFRANLTQLVQEVQGAVAQIAALAGTSTSGTIGGALAAIANAMSNTVGQFAGAGQNLASAFTEAIKTGILAGVAPAAVSTSMVIGAAISAGATVAKGGVAVGTALIAAIVSGVSSGQNAVVNAVVQVINAAISAGINESRKASSIGQEVIRTALAEINSGRSALDSAGAAAGSSIIDGMVRAISSGQSRLVNAIKAAVNAAVAAARAALGIASPSRVAIELFGNFMRTAEIPLGDPQGLVAAIGKSTRAMVDEAARVVGGLVAPALPAAAMNVGAPTMRLTQPALGSGTTSAPAAMGIRAASAPAPVYNFYGDFVVEGVEDGPGLLEQLAAMTAGARGR